MTVRIIATVLGLAALLGVATLAPPQPGGAPSASATVEIEPARQPVACPGPLVIPVGAITSGDEDLDSGSSDIEYGVRPAGEPVGDGVAIEQPQAVSLERVATGDIAGLAGAGCTAPAQDQWLVGGSTALGSSARLVLTNPTQSSVRASVEIFGPVGASDEAPSFLLGPGSQRAVLLESIAPEFAAVAVRVRAEGVGVTAALQDSRLDGFTAAGTDWVSRSALATSAVVPLAGPSSADAPATLSLVAPDGADATITLMTADGEEPWLGSETLSLEAGVVTELQVPQTGVAAIRVDASAPVASAARVTVARPAVLDPTATALDHAWTGAQDAAQSRDRAAVVPEGDVRLIVASAQAGSFTADAGGEAITVDVPDGTVASQALDLPPGTVVSSSQPMAWALVVEDTEAGFLTTIEPVVTELEPKLTEVSVGAYVPVP